MKKNIENITHDRIKDILLNEDLFDFLGIKEFGIFGSFARNEKFNDIDILIETPNDISGFYNFKEKLQKKYKLNFDFMIREFADPIILRNALKDIIYIKQDN